MAMSGSTDLERWLELSASLTPLENLALVGLLDLNPQLTADAIAPSRIVGERKCFAAGGWAAKHFRSALRVYCKASNNVGGGFTLGAIKEVGKEVVPLLTAAGIGLSVGAAAGFFGFALAYGLTNWCKRYASQDFSGEGRYWGDVPGGDIPGFFNLTYVPAISEVIREEKYPMYEHRVEIHVPEGSHGRFRPARPDLVEGICSSLHEQSVHLFEFTDTQSRKKVKGSITDVGPCKSHPNVVDYKAAEVEAPKIS